MAFWSQTSSFSFERDFSLRYLNTIVRDQLALKKTEKNCSNIVGWENIQKSIHIQPTWFMDDNYTYSNSARPKF